ncbi:MAG: YfcC family protein, partial [Gammaproteobacteria bacterium]
MTRLRFPHPLTLLVAGILLAAVLTYMIPAGQYDRRDDPETGRSVVVGGTYHRVPANPLGPLATALSIPKGIADAVQVIAAVFLVGAAFVV